MAGRELENKIICVPGNHDCNYEKDTAARQLLLGSLRTNAASIDNSVYQVISAVQDEYRAFAKEVLIDKDFTLGVNNNIPIMAGEKTILFRLYNTAWMSVKKEEQSSIVMPCSSSHTMRTLTPSNAFMIDSFDIFLLFPKSA